MAALTLLPPGTIFANDYKVLRPLAEGGMGAVYVVEQGSTGKKRALKVMHPQLAQSERGRERFTQEARIGARIESDHVVDVVSAGVDEATGTPFLVMELLEGEGLEHLVSRRGRLAPGEVLALFDQLCDALAKAHALGIVHRDLKPENLYVATSRHRGVAFTLKVLDFGIARLLQEGQTAATGTGLLGSPLWMAPEQAQTAAKIRPSTDVWALGLIAFHLLTGRYYWLSANASQFNLMALLTEIAGAPLVPASQRAYELGAGGTLPPQFDAWFARCVVRDPEARFAHAGEAYGALSQVLGGLAQSATGAPMSQPPQVVQLPYQPTVQPHSVLPQPTPQPAILSPPPESLRTPPPVTAQPVPRPGWVLPSILGGVLLVGTLGMLGLAGVGRSSQPAPAEPTTTPTTQPRAESAPPVGPPAPPVVPDPAPAPTSPPEPQGTSESTSPQVPSTVTLTSDSAAATVYRDGQVVGVAPVEVPRPASGEVLYEVTAPGRERVAVRVPHDAPRLLQVRLPEVVRRPPVRASRASSGSASAVAQPVPQPSAQPSQEGYGMDAARACLRANDNACVIRALRGHANDEPSLRLLAVTYSQMGDNRNACRTMRQYIMRYPGGPLAPRFQNQMEDGCQ